MLWDFRSIRSKLPWFSVGISKFALWQNVWMKNKVHTTKHTTKEKHNRFVCLCKYTVYYIYFRLIRARTGRFDLRYDSGVWFGGMIRGYDSRVWIAPPKTFISAVAGNWALSLSFIYRPCALPTELTWLWPHWANRVWFGYDSGMIHNKWKGPCVYTHRYMEIVCMQKYWRQLCNLCMHHYTTTCTFSSRDLGWAIYIISSSSFLVCKQSSQTH